MGETRLTYNCAHLRSTKECLTLEYLEKENESIAEKEEGGKYLKGEIVILQRRRKTGKEKEKIFGGKIYFGSSQIRGGTVWYLVVLGQYRAVLVDT